LDFIPAIGFDSVIFYSIMPECFLKGVSMPYPTKCDRCRQSMSDCCMSKFNSDYICGTCQTKEQSHPQYAIATEVAKRMSNFSGIGKPFDL
jgi:hypothetical protein